MKNIDFFDCKSSILKKLSSLMYKKKSNLALSIDVENVDQVLSISDLVSDDIVILKTHVDILRDFNSTFIKKLRSLADERGFLIFEDRKFSDIGSTSMKQFSGGLYKISSWADIINAHILPGQSIIDGLKSGCLGRDVGLLLLAQMSSKNNLFSKSYTKNVVNFAKDNRPFIIGLVAQEKLHLEKDLITLTPGVSFYQSHDFLGQQYSSPRHVIEAKESDIIIVGRSIYESSDPKSISSEYRKEGWKYFLKKHYI